MSTQNDNDKAMPTPWRLASSGLGENAAVFASDKFFCIADCNNTLSKTQDFEINQANAALIVKAVNEHAALEDCRQALDNAYETYLRSGEFDYHEAATVLNKVASLRSNQP